MNSPFSLLDRPSWRKWIPTVMVVAALLATVEIGRRIPLMGPGGGKSILILPAIVILPVVWRLLPPPRAMTVLGICLVLAPLQFSLPLGALGIIPGLNTLGIWGQILLGVAVVFLTQVALRRVPPPAASGIWLAMLVFALGGMVALLWATDGDSVRWWWTVCLLSVITCYVTGTVVHDLDQAERLLSVIVGGMIAFGLMMYLLLETRVFGLTQDSSSNWLLSVGRLGGSLSFTTPTLFGFRIEFGVGSNAPQMGEYAVIGLAVSFAYALGARSMRGRLMALAATMMLCIILLVAQARGAWITAIIAVAVISALSLTWPTAHRGRLLMRFLFFLILTVPLAVLVVQWRINVDPTGGTLLNRVIALSNITTDSSFTGRFVVWRAAWDMIRRFSFGYGFSGAFMSGGFNNPHNLYLWLLQGSGWIGALGFVLALGGLVALCLRGLNQAEPRQRVLSIAVLGVLTVVLVEGLGSVVFAVPQITAAFWAVMGVAMAINGRNQQAQSDRQQVP